MYGANDKDRSMDIRSDDEAHETQIHPFIRAHPETGRPGLFGFAGYIIGFEGLDDSEALPLLYELISWQRHEDIIHSHAWEPEVQKRHTVVTGTSVSLGVNPVVCRFFINKQ